MDTDVSVLDLRDGATRDAWRALLSSLGITNFSAAELAGIDITLGLRDGAGRLVATVSAAGDVVKYLGARCEDSRPGARFNTIVSALMSERAQRGIFHLFVFARPRAIESFEHIGFRVLARTDLGGLLETGEGGIDDYLSGLPRFEGPASARTAAIVMNANPFTCGHRALVARAAAECDHVYVFVVSDDVSLFPTAARTRLVRAGLADLPNVKIASGGPYLVSYVTFPAYFLPSSEAAVAYQTTLDARLFKRVIAPPLGITARYVGDEPLSATTARYNEALLRELPPEIDVRVMPRARAGPRPISATFVRAAIEAGALDRLAGLVPPTTRDYIEAHAPALRDALRGAHQEGMGRYGDSNKRDRRDAGVLRRPDHDLEGHRGHRDRADL